MLDKKILIAKIIEKLAKDESINKIYTDHQLELKKLIEQREKSIKEIEEKEEKISNKMKEPISEKEKTVLMDISSQNSAFFHKFKKELKDLNQLLENSIKEQVRYKK